MKTSPVGIQAIKTREGLRLKAYPDPATGGAPWTIGYGSTGVGIMKGLVITEAEAESMLLNDLDHFERGVMSLVRVPLSQCQFDALVSFTYNVGLANLRTSTLLRKLNQQDYDGAANEFPRWAFAAGKVMQGLVVRRASERKQFLTGQP